MPLASLVNVLNARYGADGIRYILIREYDRTSRQHAFRGPGDCDYELQFHLGNKDYRIYFEHCFEPPDFECREKREWAEGTKEPEWFENELTRKLGRELSALKFDEDGRLIE